MSMVLEHKLVLYAALGFLGISLLGPGLWEMFKNQPGNLNIVADSSDAKSQLRALNGMMAGLGIMALWACYDLENSRHMVIFLGVVLFLVAVARIFSMLVDGLPGISTFLYTGIELLLSGVFLLWPPGQ
jgi:uncharacterized protein DUF4345